VSPAIRPPLTRDRIVAAALGLADQAGLDAVTMRAVGAELGVEAMSLYKHVRDKSALLDGLVELVLDEVDLPTTGAWPEQVRAFGHELRQAGLRHPNVFTLVVTRRIGSVAALRPLDAVIGALREGGFDDAAAVRAFWFQLAFVTGAVLGQVADERAGSARTTDPWDAVDDFGDQLPHVAAVSPHLGGCDYDAEFEFGLERVIAALVSEERRRD
jgi:AcrR family transcriptional regulator